MRIRDLSALTGVTAKTIRYYEAIGLLPRPLRASNNYRQYTSASIDRLRLIASARTLGFSLAEIGDLLKARDENQLRCRQVLQSLDERVCEIDRRIADLLMLRATLDQIRHAGISQPPDGICDERCDCYALLVEHENNEQNTN